VRGQEEENERGRIRRRRRKQLQPCQIACRQRGRESREYEKGATNVHVASCLRIICCGRTDFQWQAAAMAPRTWCMQYLQFDCMRTRESAVLRTQARLSVPSSCMPQFAGCSPSDTCLRETGASLSIKITAALAASWCTVLATQSS